MATHSDDLPLKAAVKYVARSDNPAALQKHLFTGKVVA